MKLKFETKRTLVEMVFRIRVSGRPDRDIRRYAYLDVPTATDEPHLRYCCNAWAKQHLNRRKNPDYRWFPILYRKAGGVYGYTHPGKQALVVTDVQDYGGNENVVFETAKETLWANAKS